jgi:hypothetical protein
MLAQRFLAYGFAILCVLTYGSLMADLTRLTNNDPLPLYSSSDPYEFLSRCYRNRIEDYCEECCNGCFRIAFSPFRQSATMGKNLEEQEAQLGDLKGPWNMIGLFYDPDKRHRLIHGLGLGGHHFDHRETLSVSACDTEFGINLLTDPAGSDPNQRFGFFSVPILYRKYGVRAEAELAMGCDFTLKVKGGVAHIFQEPDFIDLSCTATGLSCPTRDCLLDQGGGAFNACETPTCCTLPSPINPSTMMGDCPNADCCINIPSCPCKELVIDKIMKRKDLIERLLGLRLDENVFTSAPFNRTGFEDIEIDLNWLHMFPINKRRCDWPFFVFTPFATLGVTIPTAPPIAHRNLFALPLGNDGHWSYGGRMGATFDFVNTLAIGGEIGFTGFTARNHRQFPAPTNELQSTIFPELVTMRVQPGFNWHFAAYLGSYRFIDRLSFYAQYMVLHHNKDEFHVLSRVEPDVPILTRKLREESSFRVHVVNTALNYEISPHMQLGFVAQIPVFQQNAYRSTTVMFTLQFFY